MRPICLSQEKLLLLSEPTEFNFNYCLVFAKGGQVKKVKTLSSMTYTPNINEYLLFMIDSIIL